MTRAVHFHKVHLCTLFTHKGCILVPIWYILGPFEKVPRPNDSFSAIFSESAHSHWCSPFHGISTANVT